MRFQIEHQTKLVGEMADYFDLPEQIDAPNAVTAATLWVGAFARLLSTLNDQTPYTFALTARH